MRRGDARCTESNDGQVNSAPAVVVGGEGLAPGRGCNPGGGAPREGVCDAREGTAGDRMCAKVNFLPYCTCRSFPRGQLTQFVEKVFTGVVLSTRLSKDT